jgi:hypothetical protein
MKRALLLFISLFLSTSVIAGKKFVEEHTLCRASVESAQKSSYLRTIGSVKHCFRPKIANPITEWNCEELKKMPRSCKRQKKKYIRCTRDYECRFLNQDITKEYMEKRIKEGETGPFFERKLSSDPSQ